MLSSSWQRDTRCGEVSVQGPPPSRSRSTAPAGRRESGGARAQSGKGERVPGVSSARDPTPRHHPTHPRLSPLRRAGTRINFPKATVGRRGWPGEPQRGPAVGPVRPVPSAARRSSHRCRGPTLTFKGAEQRLLPGHGLVVPQGQVIPRRRLDGNQEPGTRNRERGTGNGEPGTGNREWGMGPAPGAERSSPAPRAGGTLHTQVYVHLNGKHRHCCTSVVHSDTHTY